MGAILRDPASILLFSVVGVWEMQIKIQLGKLRVTRPLADSIENEQTTNGMALLPISLEHIYALDRLPAHHRDPFDRLLIAQALHEGLPIVSADKVFQSYPVQVLP